MAQTGAAEEKPPGRNLLFFLDKRTTVSLEKFPQKEAFLVGQNIFNSHSNQVQVEITTDLPTCQDLFEHFSPKDTIFSLWDFRYAWYLGYHFLPCFLVLYFQKKPVGLLPLWYESDKSQFRWFGSWWMEENSFWVFNKKYIPLLLALCPPRTYLNAITLDHPEMNSILNFEPDDPKYVLGLEKMNSIDDFLAPLKKKQRYNLKRDRRLIQEQNVKVIINRFSDLKHLIKLSTSRFEQKGDESDFVNPKRKETFKEIIKQAKSYQPRILTYEINKKIAGVDLVLLYKNSYYAIKCGYNVSQFPGIGNFANLFQIDEAIKMGFKKIDFLEVNYGWKEKLFTPLPLYCFKKELTKKEVEN